MTLTWTPIAAVLVSAILTAIATTFVTRIATRLGALDRVHPNKLHARALPRLGGVAIAIGFFVPMCALWFRVNTYEAALFSDTRRVAALLLGAIAVFALGVWDDLRGAHAWHKLLVQVPVAILSWWGGIRIGGTLGAHGYHVFSSWLSLSITVGWIVFTTNAINLIDGADGLASGLTLEILLAGALCAWLRGEPVLVLICLCLAGSVAGFLFHNFAPASIFMGDSGSMLIGYLVAAAAIWSSQKAATLIGIMLPAVALGVPLLDAVLAVLRRARAGRSVWRGDLDHIHHRLLRRGLSTRAAVLWLYGVGLVFSAMSVATVLWPSPHVGRALLAAALLLAIALSAWLGYLRPTPADEPDQR